MKKLAYLILLLFMTSCYNPQGFKGEQYSYNGIAMKGYDPVAYFTKSEAVMGELSEQFTYDGVTYLFSSSENKQLFQEEPQKYVPKYGGWCAYAVARKGAKMAPNPETWKIQDGELLLFYSDWKTPLTGNLLKEWNQNPLGFMVKADKNWSTMKTTQKVSMN